MYAARIRSLLFQKILGIIESKDVSEKFEEFYDFLEWKIVNMG